jgi:hypothetical protein
MQKANRERAAMKGKKRAGRYRDETRRSPAHTREATAAAAAGGIPFPQSAAAEKSPARRKRSGALARPSDGAERTVI